MRKQSADTYQNCQKKTKQAGKADESPKSKVLTSEKRYGIECELGSLDVETHELTGAGGKTVYRSRGDFLPSVAPRERYRSARYKELQYNFIATDSCRETAARLNRIRLQNDGAKATTIRNQTEREGEAIQSANAAKAMAAFKSSGFDATGHKLLETSIDFSEAAQKTAEREDVSDAASEIGISVDFGDYEAVDGAVNISIDEVCCKHQTEQRPCSDKEKEPKRVNNTVIHVQKENKSYVIVGETIETAIRLLMGFLLANGLLGSYPLVFFADGARTIKKAVEDYFGFATHKYILDWPHLTKKSAELLSSSIKGKDKRNEVHGNLKRLLWRGDVSAAIAFLDGLPSEYVKSTNWLKNLTDYLERNRVNIPCYAMRSRLGLRISSNLVEKTNDLVVSSRQKHNGMSWSKEGSFGLAVICSAQINGELAGWLHGQPSRFAFDCLDAA